jgi:hypothetical protein
MAYKDTLTLYDELVATGTPSEQAKIIAHQQGDLADSLVSRFEKMDAKFDQLNSKLDLSIQGLRKDLMWMKIIGGAMIVCFASNIFWLAR